MVFKPAPAPTFLDALRKHANLVHGISKEPHAQDLARMVLRLIPQLEALPQQAAGDTNGGVWGQTRAIEAFVSAAGILTRTLAQRHE